MLAEELGLGVGAAKGAVLHRSALRSGLETLLTGGGADLLASLRQRSLSGRPYQRLSASVPFVLQAHLATKQAVDDDEVHGGKDHSDAPPD
jgi:hypothetical protein